MTGDCTSGWAMRRMRERRRFTGPRAKEKVKLPAVDRIYTIEEGKGITGALCGGKPCADPKRRDAKAPDAKK